MWKWICELHLCQLFSMCVHVAVHVSKQARVRVFLCVRPRHSSSRNLRRCDLRDIGFCSFWGLKGAEVSEFQFPFKQSHKHSASLSHTPSFLSSTHLCSLLSLRQLYTWPLIFSQLHSFIPFRSHKEKSCLTPLDRTATTPPSI